MKLIFLDIDGVLNTSKNYDEWAELKKQETHNPWYDPIDDKYILKFHVPHFGHSRRTNIFNLFCFDLADS